MLPCAIRAAFYSFTSTYHMGSSVAPDMISCPQSTPPKRLNRGNGRVKVESMPEGLLTAHVIYSAIRERNPSNPLSTSAVRMPFDTSILRTKQFTFFIGVDETPIIVHAGAVASLSTPLERLVNGNFEEAQKNRARFPDIEVEDFEKICAVAYGASLPAPESRVLPATEVDIKEDFWVLSPRIIGPESLTLRNNNLTAHVLCAALGDLNQLANIPVRRDAKALYENTVEDYHRCKLLELPDEDEMVEQEQSTPYGECSGSRKSSWNRDVSSVLLSYARVYMFSEEYLIATLQKEVEAMLRNFLARMDVYSATRSGIIELVIYVYNNEIVPDRAHGELMHPLREMVVHFIALHLSAFCDFAPHRDLTRRGGDYPLDLQDVIAKWLL